MITWHPSTGINIYIDGIKYSGSEAPVSASNPSVNVQMPNFAVGRKLGIVGGTCGMFYLSSLAVFKQLVDDSMTRRIYQFFWVNSEYILSLIIIIIIIIIIINNTLFPCQRYLAFGTLIEDTLPRTFTLKIFI